MTLALLGGAPAFPDRLPLVRPTIPDLPSLERRLGRVLESGILTNGATVRELEEAVAERTGAAHVVAVSGCTAGLMLVYRCLDVRGPVVMPSFTFAASAHAVAWAGGTPRWADVSRARMTLDPASAAELLDGAAALSATHIYGNPAPVEALQQLADEAGVPLVYDAAHALGSRRAGTPIGGFGTAEVFSMSPTKVAVAGEGGLVTTSDDELARMLRIGRDYGNPGTYDCEFVGLNARMSELHAAVALQSLQGLDERIAWRNHLVDAFVKRTAGVAGIGYQVVDDGDTSTYKDLTLVVEPGEYGLSATQLAAVLKAEGVDSRHYYVPAIHQQRAYADVPPTTPLPGTDWLVERVITPPLYSHMTEEQALAVADVVVRAHESAAALREALER